MDWTHAREADLIATMVEELRAKQQTLEINFQPLNALRLAGLVQLALKHPGCDQNARGIGGKFLEGVTLYFHDCPAVLEVLRRGGPEGECTCRTCAHRASMHVNGTCVECGREGCWS